MLMKLLYLLFLLLNILVKRVLSFIKIKLISNIIV